MDIEPGTDVACETTEQALVRVEAECGWSDAVLRLIEAIAEPAVEPAVGGARAAG